MRLPIEVYEKVKAQAKAESRSVSGHIAYLLKKQLGWPVLKIFLLPPVYLCFFVVIINHRNQTGDSKMKRFTERTVRTESKWVKITRDNKERAFTFAKGYKGEYTAHEIETLSFKWVANWSEATARANIAMSY